MIPRPLGCDGDDCDYDRGGWFHIDCELAQGQIASSIRHPSMLPTRKQFKVTPLPRPQNRSWS
ncbi:hypothetical protein ACFWFU_07115 [Streptomyces sp. NPDC060235]|uniref:hypothetical protein n=1 Tax=Streptomyces sp. NPDC060235 TaxID=3347080 RepID=UPI00366A20CC